MKKLNDMKECFICMEKYDLKNNIPKILGCGHTFCTICLNDIKLKENGKIICPLCRQESNENEIDKLPINRVIIDLLDIELENYKSRIQIEKIANQIEVEESGTKLTVKIEDNKILMNLTQNSVTNSIYLGKNDFENITHKVYSDIEECFNLLSKEINSKNYLLENKKLIINPICGNKEIGIIEFEFIKQTILPPLVGTPDNPKSNTNINLYPKKSEVINIRNANDNSKNQYVKPTFLHIVENPEIPSTNQGLNKLPRKKDVVNNEYEREIKQQENEENIWQKIFSGNIIIKLLGIIMDLGILVFVLVIFIVYKKTFYKAKNECNTVFPEDIKGYELIFGKKLYSIKKDGLLIAHLVFLGIIMVLDIIQIFIMKSLKYWAKFIIAIIALVLLINFMNIYSYDFGFLEHKSDDEAMPYIIQYKNRYSTVYMWLDDIHRLAQEFYKSCFKGTNSRKIVLGMFIIIITLSAVNIIALCFIKKYRTFNSDKKTCCCFTDNCYLQDTQFIDSCSECNW